MEKPQFQRFILKLSDPLFRFALWRLGNREDAQDLVQDTFAKLWQMRKKLTFYEKPDALAYRILRNLCIDQKRKRAPKILALHQSDLAMLDGFTAQKKMEQKEALEEAIQSLRSLPELQQSIFFMRHIEGMEIKEIAQILDLKVNTIHANISRARKKLKALKNNSYGN